jgi:hypothetical protein
LHGAGSGQPRQHEFSIALSDRDDGAIDHGRIQPLHRTIESQAGVVLLHDNRSRCLRRQIAVALDVAGEQRIAWREPWKNRHE